MTKRFSGLSEEDAYRNDYADQTAHWPETPNPGECYTPAGDAP